MWHFKGPPFDFRRVECSEKFSSTFFQDHYLNHNYKKHKNDDFSLTACV